VASACKQLQTNMNQRSNDRRLRPRQLNTSGIYAQTRCQNSKFARSHIGCDLLTGGEHQSHNSGRRVYIRVLRVTLVNAQRTSRRERPGTTVKAWKIRVCPATPFASISARALTSAPVDSTDGETPQHGPVQRVRDGSGYVFPSTGAGRIRLRKPQC
jgi:hypothetical protein